MFRERLNLLDENSKLKEENKALVERMDNLGYILADLQTKIKIAEEKKARLMTAIRLIQSNIDVNYTANKSVEPDRITENRCIKKKNNKSHRKKNELENNLHNLKNIHYRVENKSETFCELIDSPP